MIKDHSEVTATLQRAIPRLTEALEQQKWHEAFDIAISLIGDLTKLVYWIASTKMKGPKHGK